MLSEKVPGLPSFLQLQGTPQTPLAFLVDLHSFRIHLPLDILSEGRIYPFSQELLNGRRLQLLVEMSIASPPQGSNGYASTIQTPLYRLQICLPTLRCLFHHFLEAPHCSHWHHTAPETESSAESKCTPPWWLLMEIIGACRGS